MKSDKWSGLLFISLSVFMYLRADELPPTMYGTLGAGVFPKVLFSLLTLLGVILTISSIARERKAKPAPKEISRGTGPEAGDGEKLLGGLSTYSYVLTGFISVLGYIFIMKYVGYLVGTLIFMPTLMWILGPRNLKAAWITASVTIGVTFSIYLLFQKALRIFLPEGELF